MSDNILSKYTWFFICIFSAVLIGHMSINVYSGMRIYWVLLMLLVWILEDNSPIVGPIIAFFIGVSLDLIDNKIMGMYGGIYAIMAYLALLFHSGYQSGGWIKKITFIFLLVSAGHFFITWEFHLFYRVGFHGSNIQTIVGNTLVLIILSRLFSLLKVSNMYRAIHE